MTTGPGHPLVVCDLGETLVRGPALGPAARLTQRLGLPSDPGLSTVLMTTQLEQPAELAALLAQRYAISSVRAREAAGELWNSQLENAQPVDGALDALRALHAAGIRLALLSNIWAPYNQAVRRWFGPLFDAAIPDELQCLSYREGLAKPAPELFATLLVRAGTPAAQAIMVGDSLSRDILPASRLGMRTVLIAGQPAASCARAADRTIASAAELTVELVEELCSAEASATAPREVLRVLR
jgi:FMN phosphatase YigB (HAD superfamily)